MIVQILGLEGLGALLDHYFPQTASALVASVVHENVIALKNGWCVPDVDAIVLRPQSERVVGLKGHAEFEVVLCAGQGSCPKPSRLAGDQRTLDVVVEALETRLEHLRQVSARPMLEIAGPDGLRTLSRLPGERLMLIRVGDLNERYLFTAGDSSLTP